MTTTSYDACSSHESHDHGHSHSSSNNHDEGPHDHNGDHSHHHSHGDEESGGSNHVLRKLKTATALCVTFFLVEVTGGYLAGSLAVLSDAAHLLADLASFAVAIAASHLGSLPTTDQHTFGLKRVESLAALFSMISLALVSVGLFVEAIRRLVMPPEQAVDGPLMSGIAAIGVVVNVILAFVLGEHHVHMPGASHDHDHSHGHEHNTHEEALLECGDLNDVPQHSDELPPPTTKKVRNINLHAAYLHVLGDLAQSVAVLIAGLVIWWKPTWQVVDPICTLLFCALVFYSTLGVLRSSISVLLEEVPPNLSWRELHDDIQNVPGVEGVHDLHIWSISHSIPTLSVHCFSQNPQQALENIYVVCQSKGIVHATIQIQKGDASQVCITCTSDKACHSVETSNQNSFHCNDVHN
jgi:cation diffusion facilitator family transporter